MAVATAATGFARSSALEPAKTLGPTPSSALVANTAAVNTAAPALPSSSTPPPTFLASGTTTPGGPAPSTPTSEFDAAALFTEMFDTLVQDLPSVTDLRDRFVPESSADFFLLYLFLSSGVVLANTASGFPPVTVTATANGLDVCTEGRTPCDVFSDFVVEDGLLDSFSINKTTIDGRFGVVAGSRSYESLTLDAGISYRLINQQQLVVLVLMSAESGTAGAEIRWSEAVFTDVNGTALPVDLTISLVPESVQGGESTGAMLRFPDAPPAGTLTVPVSSDGFATSSTATLVYIPV
ncbi:hypothetical protein BH24ACT5_BH24ACT5_13360 [soil metagenome]